MIISILKMRKQTWRGFLTLSEVNMEMLGRTEAHLELGCPPSVTGNIFSFFRAWPGHGKPHMWFCGCPHRPKNSQ